MSKFIVVTLLVLGTCTVAMAAMAGVTTVPEIDVTTGVAAVALVASAILIIRGRRKK